MTITKYIQAESLCCRKFEQIHLPANVLELWEPVLGSQSRTSAAKAAPDFAAAARINPRHGGQACPDEKQDGTNRRRSDSRTSGAKAQLQGMLNVGAKAPTPEKAHQGAQSEVMERANFVTALARREAVRRFDSRTSAAKAALDSAATARINPCPDEKPYGTNRRRADSCTSGTKAQLQGTLNVGAKAPTPETADFRPSQNPLGTGRQGLAPGEM